MAVHTLIDLFDERVAERGSAAALRHRVDGRATTVAWSEWLRSSNKLAAGLVAAGVERGDRVGIFMHPGADWLVVDQAVLLCGAVPVPLHHGIQPGHVRIIGGDAQLKAIFVDDSALLARVADALEEISSLSTVICLDDCPAGDTSSGRRFRRLTIGELREIGADAIGREPNVVLNRRRLVTAADLAGIIYTSGASGRPRGVELTHGAFVAAARGIVSALPIGPSDEFLLSVPLSHAFGRAAYLAAMAAGAVTIVASTPEQAIDDLQYFRPTVLAGVPRLYEKLRDRILAAQAQLSPRLNRSVEGLAERVSRARRDGAALGVRDRVASIFADRTVFAQARRFMGGRLRFGVSGAAAFPEPVARFYDGIGIPVLEGYGMTETCSTVTIEHLDRTRIGTVGRPLAGVEVRLAPDGEVLVRGPTLMRGYHNDPLATGAVLIDGWLHTGDTGELESDTLRITGRKRDIVVLASGRTVAPLGHESELRTLPLVDNAVVCGDGRPYLTALLSLDLVALRRWAAESSIHERDDDRLRRHPKVYEAVREMVDELNATRLSSDPIRRFAILDAFTPESGETTPTWMTRRRFVSEKYRAVIDGLYEAR